MKIILKKRKKAKTDLESFLKKKKIKMHLENEPNQKHMTFVIHTDPHVCVKSGDGGHTGHDGYGEFADLAMRDFLESISGKQITLDSGQNYFYCPELIWDGILRVEVLTKK